MLLAEAGALVGEPGAAQAAVYRIAQRDGVDERIVRVDQFNVAATNEAPAAKLWLLSDSTLSETVPEADPHESQVAPPRETSLESVRREFSQDRDELIALLSHELRTPLTVISGYSKLLLSGRVGDLSDEQRRYLEESRNSCQRLNEFVLDLLDASHDPSHAIALRLEDRPVEPAIRAVIEFFLPLLEEKNLAVEIDAQTELSLGRFDPVRIGQVLTNLLGNAVKYTKSGSEINVSVREVLKAERPMIEIAMTDDGPGIALDDSQRIFEPYVRSTGDRRPGGVGLGLAICRRILTAHGGEIWVENAPGRGSRFAFLLPAVQYDSRVEC
jgi:signal transduction histidine kinase